MGKSEGAGDVSEQRGHEAQQGMLVSTEMERMKKIPRDPPLRKALTTQIRDGVASRRTKDKGWNLDSDPQSMQAAYRLIPDPACP